MPIEILGEAMTRIASAQQDPEELGSGFGGRNGPAEGPVWWQEGGYLLFSDIHASKRACGQDAGIGVAPGLDIDAGDGLRIADELQGR